LFSGFVLILLGYHIRILRKLLSEFRQELNLSSLIARLVGGSEPHLTSGGTIPDFLQAVADTIREGTQAVFVLTYQFVNDHGKAVFVGSSPATLITYFASDQLQQPLWKEEPLYFSARSASARALMSGQSIVVRTPAEVLDSGPSLTFLESLCREWSVRKCYLGTLTVGDKPMAGFICGVAQANFRPGQLTYLERVRHLTSVMLNSFIQRESQRALLEALTRKQDRLRLLNRIAQAVNANLERGALISGSIREMEHLFPDLPVVILLKEPGKEGCFCIGGASSAASRMFPEGVSMGSLVSLSSEIREQLASLTERSFLRLSSSALPDPLHVLPSPFIFRIATPSKMFGVCVVAPPPQSAFTEEDLEFFQFFTDHLALGIQNAENMQGLQTAYEQLRLSQEMMTKQENLRVLGQMASAITHDINNLLTPVFAYLELSLSDPTLSPETANYLKTAQKASEQIAQIVQRMREFYRDTPLERSPIDVSELIQNAIRLTEPRWKTMPQSSGIVITVRTAVEENLPLVEGSQAQLTRALVNIIVNAVEAMPRGGAITIRAYRTATPPDLSSGAVPGPEFVVIEVRDEGVGMSAETLHRASEPFFTTKEKTGSGLGLAIVRATAERHGGRLEIESEPGRGTVIRMVLPAAPVTTPVSVPRGRLAPAQDSTAQRLRILVVDDEPVVLQGVSELLRKNGHTVFTAGSGPDALEIASDIARARERLDVVITDLGMPEMDGITLAGRLKSIAAHARVILLTGWGRSAETIEASPADVDAILEKPVREGELLAVLASVLPAAGP
jgi:signal transduction histidine kinase/ActR/RegA family two-component response regulator